MSRLASASEPVIWHEGLFLAPQHFQHAERHQRWLRQRVVLALDPHSWGLSALAFDGQALASGTIAIVHAEGIMPDGLVFAVGGEDAPPPARQVELPADAERIALYLAVASERSGATSASDDGLADGRPTRWRRVERAVSDEHGSGLRDATLASVNLRLVIAGEPLDDLCWMRIAELGRGPAGGLALLDGHAPPSLNVAASAPLRACTRRVAEMVAARHAELAAQRRGRARGAVDIAAADLAVYFALQALGAHLPAISAAATVGDAHPRAVHAELARLAGALCALSLEHAPQQLPTYRHDDALPGLLALEGTIRSLLGAGARARCAALPATRADERVVAVTLPEHALDDARLVLAIASDCPPERLLRELPLKSKVAALGRLDALIAQALRGLRLAFLAVPPAEVPTRPGWTYFEIAREGDEWRAAREARSLAVYLPVELAAATIEILAVRS